MAATPRPSRMRQRMRNLQEVCVEISDIVSSVNCRGCIKNTCSCQNLKSKLPILTWLPKYRLEHFQGDVIAGLTVGLTVIPQGLAYAQIAELPAQYGLYSAFMGCFVYCLLGTAKDITMGPTAIMSLMTAAFAQSRIQGDATYAIVLAFFSGCLQLLMGFLSLGFVVDFISYPVINSFTTSAAITIAVSQIQKWLGLKGVPRDFIHQVIKTCQLLPETKIWDFVLGLVCIIILYILKRLKNIKYNETAELPLCTKIWRKTIWLLGTARNALVVIVAAGVTAGLLSHGINVFTLTGEITPGLPPFNFPHFSVTKGNQTITTGQIFSDLGSGLAIVPIMCVVENIAIGNAFARKNNYRILPNQELLALGVANIVGSFVSSYPVTGSFSRTAVNSQSGVATPAGGIFTGVLVIVSLVLLTAQFKYIPQSALAAVIIMAVLDMVSFQMIPKLWRVKKSDLIPWFVTFFLSFIFGIEYGIIAGIGVSMLMLMYPWARPQIQSVTLNHSTSSATNHNPSEYRDVIILQLRQGVHYPGIEHIKNKLLLYASEADNPKSVILDCCHVANIDYTVTQGISQLIEDFKSKGLTFVLTNLQPDILEAITKANIPELQYSNNVQEALKLLLRENSPDENATEPLLNQGVLAAASAGPAVVCNKEDDPAEIKVNCIDATAPSDVEEETKFNLKRANNIQT